MKRFSIYLTLFFLLLTVGSAIALPVGSQQAKQTAQRFWQNQGLKGDLVEQPTEFAYLYLYTGTEGGFVVVSGDDMARPVLAWGDDVVVDNTLHASVLEWLQGYDRQIARAVSIGLQSSIQGHSPKSDGDPLTVVGPLLTTQWNQGDYYNDSCPVVDNRHCYTGCVATAAAQVMKYWNWPVTGRGSHSYDIYGTQTADFGATTYVWSQMPNALTSVSSAAQKAAVAQLMYHVGVAVEMSYGLEMSSAYDVSGGSGKACSEHALKQYFGYSNQVRSLSRGSYSQQEWFAIIQQEIDQQRPVLYTGESVSAGHAFVCDGYDSQQRLHINWGWGGAYDGFFYSDALTPSGSGIGGNSESDYSMSQGMIIGITPDNATYNPEAQFNVALAATTGGTVSGDGTYPVGTYSTLAAQAGDGYRFDCWSDSVRWNPRTLPVCGDINLTATFIRADATDTLQWDNGAFTGSYYTNPSWFGNYNQPISRSVSFDGSMMAGRQRLTAVMYYTIDTGMHTVTVYYGNDESSTKTARALYPGFWNTIYLNDEVPLDVNHGISVAVTWPEKAPVMASDVYPIRAISDGMFRPHVLTVVGGTGSGVYPTDIAVSITATPPDTNYRFSQWSDGDTHSTRVVQLVSDTTLTAQFIYLLKRVTLVTWGYYYDAEGEIQDIIFQDTTMLLREGWNTIEARTPVQGYHFTNWVWEDSVCYDNPRRVYINSDTSFHSIFYRRVVYLDISVNDASLGVTSRPSGYTSREHYFEIYASALHPNAYVTSWTAPAYGATNPVTYDTYESTSMVSFVFSEADTCAWPDTVQIAVRFDTISGNTLAYFPTADGYPADASEYNSMYFSHEGLMRWAVKYDGSAFRDNHFIRQVKLYAKNGTRDTLRIYQGGDEAPATLLHTQVLDFTGYTSLWSEWRTIDLSSAVEVSGNSPVWVVLSSNTMIETSNQFSGDYLMYPCTRINYTGNPNGSLWYTPQHGWQPIRLGYDYDNGYSIVDPTSENPIACSWAVSLITSASSVESYTVTVVSDNPTMGEVEGGGTFASGSTTVIRALPHEGIRFTHWQDGSTVNPRTVTVNSDITYTAYFEPIPQTYTVMVRSNNDEWGTVSGGGTYEQGESAHLQATPNSGYRFVQWDDGNTHASRTVTVAQDITYTATFEPDEVGIDDVDGSHLQVAVYPNPSQGSVTISVSKPSTLTILDLSGRTVVPTTTLNSQFSILDLNKGVYFVRLTDEGSVMVQKLIVR